MAPVVYGGLWPEGDVRWPPHPGRKPESALPGRRLPKGAAGLLATRRVVTVVGRRVVGLGLAFAVCGAGDVADRARTTACTHPPPAAVNARLASSVPAAYSS